MTTAPTPSEKVQRLAITLEIVGAVPDMNYVTVPRHVARDASAELRRLQADNERLRGDYALRGAQIQRMAALIDELEARKPLPLSDEQLRAEFIPWAEIQYRHEDEFSKRDFEICLAAWSAGRRITGGSS